MILYTLSTLLSRGMSNHLISEAGIQKEFLSKKKTEVTGNHLMVMVKCIFSD